VYRPIDSIPDTLRYAGHFLQNHAIKMQPQWIQHAHNQSTILILLGLLGFFGFLRFFYPSAVRATLSPGGLPGSRQATDKYSRQGWMIPLFLTVNFIVSLTLFVEIALIKTAPYPDTFSSLWKIALAVALFYILEQILTLLAGFIFNTRSQARLQVKNTAFWAYASGIILTPLLLFYLYSGRYFLIEFMAITLAGILVFKWFQTFRIGLTGSDYHLLHLFLYLCTVEIVPLIIVVKTGMLYLM
jgi:hypothetical protein